MPQLLSLTTTITSVFFRYFLSMANTAAFSNCFGKILSPFSI